MNILSVPSRLRFLYVASNEFLHNYKDIFTKQRQFMEFAELQMEAANVHRATYVKYKGINKGKDVAVIGSGPTLDLWNIKTDVIQIGVNGTFMSDKVNLDYWFMQDNNINMLSKAETHIKKDCKKFLGMHYMLPAVQPIPFAVSEKMGAERYFFYDCPAHMFPYDFTVDIASRPFITYGSTIFVALQFALYTRPKRLYIVGCDCSSGHFSSHKAKLHDNDLGSVKAIIEGWRKFAQFAHALFPDTEIISVNPVGLKGLFRDEYSNSYSTLGTRSATSDRVDGIIGNSDTHVEAGT